MPQSALADIIAIVLFIVDEILEKFFGAVSTGGNLAGNATLFQCNGYYTVTPTSCGQLLIDNLAQAVSGLAGLAGPIFNALGTAS